MITRFLRQSSYPRCLTSKGRLSKVGCKIQNRKCTLACNKPTFYKPKIQQRITQSWSIKPTRILFERNTFSQKRLFSTESASEKHETIATKDIRASLRPLFLKVHPDFFGSHPTIQQQNDKSLKQLNSLLDLLDEYNESYGDGAGNIILDKNKCPQRISLMFHIKAVKVNESSEFSVPQISSEFQTIAADYTFPPHFFQTPFPKKMLEREVRTVINSLLHQVGLPTLPLPDIGIPGKESEEEHEEEIGHVDVKTASSRARKRYRVEEAVAETLNKDLDESELFYIKFEKSDPGGDTSGDYWRGADFARRLHTSWAQQAVFAEGVVTGEQRGIARERIQQLWQKSVLPADLPIIVTQSGNYIEASLIPGFITIPWDFDPKELKEYLARNLAKAQSYRNQIRQHILMAEHFERHLREAWRVSSIEVYQSLEDTVLLLNNLANHSDEIAKYAPLLEGFNLEFSIVRTEPSIDLESDTIYFPHTITVPEMVKFIEKETPLLKLRAMLNPHALEFVLAVQQSLKQISRQIGTRVLIDSSIAKKRPIQEEAIKHFAANVDTIINAAKQSDIDITKVTLYIGVSYGISVRQRKIILPYNFKSEAELVKVFQAYLKRMAQYSAVQS